MATSLATVCPALHPFPHLSLEYPAGVDDLLPASRALRPAESTHVGNIGIDFVLLKPLINRTKQRAKGTILRDPSEHPSTHRAFKFYILDTFKMDVFRLSMENHEHADVQQPLQDA